MVRHFFVAFVSVNDPTKTLSYLVFQRSEVGHDPSRAIRLGQS